MAGGPTPRWAPGASDRYPAQLVSVRDGVPRSGCVLPGRRLAQDARSEPLAVMDGHVRTGVGATRPCVRNRVRQPPEALGVPDQARRAR